MKKTSYQTGEFCWADLGTNDIAAAKAFYGELFGWSYDEVVTDGMPYTMALVNGSQVAALYTMPEDEAAKAPPHWNVYVSVDDVDGTVAKVAGLGGKLMAPAFDVATFGRLGLVADPTGAILCLWQGKQHPGAQLWGEPGAIGWCELATGDPAKARDFYTQLLGWGAKVSPEYTEWEVGKQSVGGMMALDPAWGAMPPSWSIYLQVNDCDDVATRAGKLGGRVLMPPRDIEKVGRFSVLADPTGAIFSIIKIG